jgi:hypothetical protein
VIFYDRLYETAQIHENMAKKPENRIFSAISRGAIMPELSLAAKKFGSCSRHRIIAWPA